MANTDDQRDAGLMPFGDHLDELRKRFVYILLAVVPVFVVALVYGDTLLEFLLRPLRAALLESGQPPTVLATSPLEPFVAYLKISFVLALLVATPWILIQLWFFIAPGLYRRERRFVYFLIPLSTVLTSLGMVFLYTVLLPISLGFLIVFNAGLVGRSIERAPLAPDVVLPAAPVLDAAPSEEDIESGRVPPGSFWYDDDDQALRLLTPRGDIVTLQARGDGLIAQEFRIGEYITLVFTLALVFAISSQLPVVMLLLGWLGVLVPGDITPFRRHVGFGCAVAGALLTPQDPVSMIALGGALYMLFELGIVLMRFVPASAVAGGFRGDDGDER
jgi:sec-independent protein translocase protein TatC